MGKYRFGFHRYGNCWPFRLRKDWYFSGFMTWWSFWRFYFVIDNRRDERASEAQPPTVAHLRSQCNDVASEPKPIAPRIRERPTAIEAGRSWMEQPLPRYPD